MTDFAPLASPVARESFFAFVRELFALCDAPFDAREDTGEQFSDYERGTPPSWTSREGSRWTSGDRVAEVRLHVEYFNPRDGQWSQLEAEVRGLPGGARLELEGDADDTTRGLVRARVIGGDDGAGDRWRRIIDDAATAARVLGSSSTSGARGES